MTDHLVQGLSHRYRIQRELGRGGMATVYLARDLRGERPVAIKVLLPAVASLVGSERFLQEIRIVANLRHPHILPLLDSGDVDGIPFYVMPYLEGESLRERLLREGQLPIPDVIQIGREVADALAYAHEKGVVHRDIKPANIMMDSGHAVVADFGIALAELPWGPHRLTSPGASPGSPHYMSPEQASGDQRIDGRSDIYSLGCVLYEALAGDPPFTGRMAQTILSRKLAESPPGVRLARETVPANLERVVARALARSPADRFRTARDLKEALAAVVSDGGSAGPWAGTEEGRVPDPRRPWRWAGRLAQILLAAVALLTAAGFVTTRIYDVKLRIPAEFTPSRADFPLVGLQALVPILFYAFVAILGSAVLGQVGRAAAYGLRRAAHVGDTLDSLRRSSTEVWRGIVSRPGPIAVADVFFVVSFLAGILLLLPFRELLASLWSGAVEGLSVSHRSMHTQYTLVLTLLILVLSVAWWNVFRHQKGREPPGLRFQISKWGSLAWILVLVLAASAPWRLLWNNEHERALLEGERAYLIMETEEDVVLYRPSTRSSARYPKDSTLDLTRFGTTGYLFEAPQTFERARAAQGGE